MTSEIFEQNNENISEIKLKKKSSSKKAMRKEFNVKPANIITNIVVWAAKERHPLAMYLMGLFFLGYYKVYPDFEKAVFWFKRAIKYEANKGFGGVEYYLGHCYESGFGIEQDKEKALELYNIAANKKFPKAMKKLSVCYAKGFLGCNTNKELSMKWNKLYEEQKKYIWNKENALTNTGYEVDVFAGEEQLIDVIEDAREVGNVEAEYCLGLFYDAGFGGIIERNKKLALQCFKSAASKGHAGAMYFVVKYAENDIVNEGNQQIVSEEGEELAKRNTLLLSSSEIKSEIPIVQNVINNKVHKRDKGKAPENDINTTFSSNVIYISNPSSSCGRNTNLYHNFLSNNHQNTNSDGSSSSSNIHSIPISIELNNKRIENQTLSNQLPPLVKESYPIEIIENELETINTEFTENPFYPNQNKLTETERELNEVKKLSEEYNRIVDEVNKENNNEKIFGGNTGEINILENEIIGSDYSDSVDNIKYNHESSLKSSILSKIPEEDNKDNEEEGIDLKIKIKKGHNLFNRVKDFGNKFKINDLKDDVDHTSTKFEEKKIGYGFKNHGEKTQNGFKILGNKTKELGSEMKGSIDNTSNAIGGSQVNQEFKNINGKSENDIKDFGNDIKDLNNEKTKNIKENIKDKSNDQSKSKLDKINEDGNTEEIKERINENVKKEKDIIEEIKTTTNILKNKENTNSKKLFGSGFRKFFLGSK